MFKETFVVPCPAGIHHGTLGAFFAHFKPGTVHINGIDPLDPKHADELAGIDMGTPVEISANTGDPQLDRDTVHIAEGLIAQGRDPWQRADGQKMNLPIERYNQAANFVRQNWLSLPAEEPAPMQPLASYSEKPVCPACFNEIWRTPHNCTDGPSPDDIADYARTLPDDEPGSVTFPSEWVQKAAKWRSLASELLPITDIAKKLGITPSALSNWKKRRPDFPQPKQTMEVGQKVYGLYDLDEFTQWLEGYGGVGTSLNPRGNPAGQPKQPTPAPKYPWEAPPEPLPEAGTEDVNAVVQRFYKEHGRFPTDADLAELMQQHQEQWARPPGLASTKWAYVESATSADVSSDMSVTSKWKVVAQGELQQPGGVGATQEYNPVVDGPNPEGPEIDNAQNSPEQEVAMQTWVNTAVDMLNRGEDPQAIIAKLSHDGCPDPEQILQRAQQQPMEQPHPVSDSIGQDPFQAPPPADQTGEMQSLSQQPATLASNANEVGGPIGQPADSASTDNTDGTLMKIDIGENPDEADLFNLDDASDAENKTPKVEFEDEAPVQETKDVHSKRVRVAGTTMTGRELDRWEDMWGEGTVKIALDEGGTINVDPSAVEPIGDGGYKHPVTEIQKFIDGMPEVQPTRPHIEARIANLEQVRRAVRSNISKVSFSDQQKLARFDREAEEESALLKEALDNTVEEYEVEYFKHLPGYQINAFNVATPEIREWKGRPREAGAIWASENFTATVDDESFMAAAAHHASALGLTGTQFQEFLAGADKHRTDKCPNCGASVTAHTGDYCHACGETLTKKSATEAEDHEGPAEALFV